MEIVGIKSTAQTQISINTYFAITPSQDVHHVTTIYHVQIVTMVTICTPIKYYGVILIANLAVKPFPDVKSVKIKQVVVNALYLISIMMVNVLPNLEIL